MMTPRGTNRDHLRHRSLVASGDGRTAGDQEARFRWRLLTVLGAALFAVLLVGAGSGCCCMNVNGCGVGPFDFCNEGCGPCGPFTVGAPTCGIPEATHGDCVGCGVSPGPRGDCAGCGPTGGYYCWSPLRALRDVLTCKSGCGELYYDEWINEPPARCDPCDCRGNWVGGSCCNSCLPSLKQLCGIPYHGDCGSCDGCCEVGGAEYETYYEGEVIEEVHRGPTPSAAQKPDSIEPPPKPMLDETARGAGRRQPRARYAASRTRR